MAMVRSKDGRCFEIPDAELSKFEKKLDEIPEGERFGGAPRGSDVQGRYCGWHNCWRNCWRNHHFFCH